MDANGVLREVRTELLHTSKRSHVRGAYDFANALESVTTVDKWCDHLRRVQITNIRTRPEKIFFCVFETLRFHLWNLFNLGVKMEIRSIGLPELFLFVIICLILREEV
jgi:hypothetical protein